ncbi:MAG TPA: site-specific DNA-methyltransferase [Phycisphaerae bacterium]|nr:site-specific DNA-methyltransferase [Phycisphaerae bacterium]HNU46258.1 site-specific DNA-methyltransferase [Phycisphaerae bacterium]
MPTLDWIGKKAVLNHHKQVPYRLLHCDASLSAGGPDAGNLLVQGDNLEALKALLPYYAGKVKCIYIDPPYNTGNEKWVYNDAVNSPEMRHWLGKVVGAEAEDLSRHDKWLCMMYPRLALLREFLTEDGVLFVSIDDTELQGLRGMMDELFGVRNFVANAVWQKRTSPDMRLSFSTAHDYVVLYAKNSDTVRFRKIPKSKKQAAQFKNPDNDPRGPWVSSDYTAQGYRPNQMYTIRTPGGKEYRPPPGVCWKNVESVFLELVRDGRIWFGKDGNAMPRRKTFLSESGGNSVWTWWSNDEVGHTQEAKKEVVALLGDENAFDTPKPTRLIRRILEIATDRDSIVLDSFAGSATTGHAVLALNKADGGQRRFVLVEMDESIAASVAAQRLRRVVEGKGDAVPACGGGFRYCKLGEPLFDERGNIHESVRFPELAGHVFFTETGAPIPRTPRRANGADPHPSPLPGRERGYSPLLGVHNGKAVYLLFNGVMGDKRPNGGNVLTGAVLRELPDASPSQGEVTVRVIYGESCRLGAARLKREGIVFRQIPYEIKVT